VLAGAGEHDRADVAVALEVVERRGQLPAGGEVDCVGALGSIDGHDEHSPTLPTLARHAQARLPFAVRGNATRPPNNPMSDGSSTLLADRPGDGVLRLRLNRPARHNAVDAELLAALHGALAQPEARAIVLGSATAGQFCAGADLAVGAAERASVSDGLYDLYRRIVRLNIPVVAAISGPAVGGGAQLAVACDLRVAAPAAWLQFVGPEHGLAVGAWALPTLVGRGRAIDLCLTGRRVEAGEALAIGLVDRVAEDADAAAVALAGELTRLDAAAVARVKAIMAGERERALDVETRGNRGWSGALPRHGEDVLDPRRARE
jgi:enoyl-CoA hydratase